MRPASGCKLFGAYQALGGIQDGVVLLHSVVGCNFGSMSLHVAQDMRDIRQTCTVISDSDVVFSGEASLERAVRSALELFQPSVLFVVSGCVSEMIGDDIPAVLARIPHEAPLLHVEAAGFRGDAARGLEAGWLALLPLMKPPVPRPYPRPYPRSDPRPMVNLIGLGMDDPHAADDVEALRAMLAPQAALGAVLSRCTLEEVRRAPYADVNLVLRGKGRELAQAMKEYFGIPWEELDYPYGAAGADDLWSRLELLSGFEPETSSLPTDWENEISCVRTLLCPFPSGDPCSPSLLSPLFPPARFPVWVSVWVSKVVPLKISTTISKAQYFTHRRFLSVFNCSRRGAGTLGSNF